MAKIKHNATNYLSSAMFSLAVLATGITGCSDPAPAPPMCRADADEEPVVSANAGCLIRLDNRLLTITHRLSDKLDIPGGTAPDGESAMCTAHRETWEETGFNVKVKKFLGTSQQGFRFYQCELAGNFTGEIARFPVPQWSETEVSSIQLVDPFVITPKQWRFGEQLIHVRNMFNRIPEPESAEMPPVEVESTAPTQPDA